MNPIQTVLERAAASGMALRLHLGGGEVIVARILAVGGGRVRAMVLQSSRPEKHAHCDSTGLDIALEDVVRVTSVRRGSRNGGET